MASCAILYPSGRRRTAWLLVHVYVCVCACVCVCVCMCVRPLLTESLCSLQGLRGCVGHIEALDSHAALLHQLLALVLLQIQPSPGTQPGALEGKKGRRGGRMSKRDFKVKDTKRSAITRYHLDDLYLMITVSPALPAEVFYIIQHYSMSNTCLWVHGLHPFSSSLLLAPRLSPLLPSLSPLFSQ